MNSVHIPKIKNLFTQIKYGQINGIKNSLTPVNLLYFIGDFLKKKKKIVILIKIRYRIVRMGESTNESFRNICRWYVENIKHKPKSDH